MAKWFKEFPINLKTGADRLRSASESGSQPRASRTGLVASIGTRATGSKPRKNSSADPAGGAGGAGGVGSLLSGRNRKNSAVDLSRSSGTSSKDGKVWDSLLSGKGRKNSKAEPVFEEHRTAKSCSSNAYMNRLIRLDQQDKTPNVSSGTVGHQVPPDAEKAAQSKPDTVSVHLYLSPNISGTKHTGQQTTSCPF